MIKLQGSPSLVWTRGALKFDHDPPGIDEVGYQPLKIAYNFPE